jgi:hypothetical protein
MEVNRISFGTGSAMFSCHFLVICYGITVSYKCSVMITNLLLCLQVHSPCLRVQAVTSRQTMPDLYISQILLQSYCNVIVWERICDGGKFFCSMYKLFGKNLEYDRHTNS